jgi:hypothetical protein
VGSTPGVMSGGGGVKHKHRRAASTMLRQWLDLHWRGWAAVVILYTAEMQLVQPETT